MDLYMVLFIFTSGYAQSRSWGVNGAILTVSETVIAGLIPYMAGKLLIERGGIRIATIKRFGSLVAVGCVIGMYEYFLKNNPYRYFWSHFFPGQWGGQVTQIRWGFGRMAGPYLQSELAGMIIMAALLMVGWLKNQGTPQNSSRLRIPGSLKHMPLLFGVLIVALFMTQARGPWIGTIVAFVIASIGRSKYPLRRTAVVLALFVLVGAPVYVLGKDYLSGPRTNFGSERETAQYRAELIDNYIPIAKSGGAWGWGQPFPTVDGQTSIDNEFLFIWVIQGYVGLIALLLLFVEAILTLFRMGLKAQPGPDRSFVFSMLGILCGMAFTLSTVFLGAQSYELFFLLLGWSQTIRPTPTEPLGTPENALPQQLSRLEVMTVYT